jgi:ABC-type polysaccharide/polyol phosphate export permease
MVKDAFPDFLSKLYMYNPFVEIINLYRIVLLKGFYQGLHKEVGLFVLIGVPLLFALAVLLFSVYIYKIKRKNLNDYLSY